MRYIQIKSEGARVLINAEHVSTVTAHTEGSTVELEGGQVIEADESYMAVRNRIDKANQGISEDAE